LLPRAIQLRIATAHQFGRRECVVGSDRSRVCAAVSAPLLAITGRIVCSPQIDLDSKTPVPIALWKDAHAVGMFSVKAVLAAMIERLALKVIGMANI